MCAAFDAERQQSSSHCRRRTDLAGRRMIKAQRVGQRVVRSSHEAERRKGEERLAELAGEGAAVLGVDERLDDVLDLATVDREPLLVLETRSCEARVRLLRVKLVDDALDEDE